ncbi:MAG: hypothetical protein KC656_03425, partial [Myxococcales bacterium]|nr:hypothetical protein [Myxococcales bacterium]
MLWMAAALAGTAMLETTDGGMKVHVEPDRGWTLAEEMPARMVVVVVPADARKKVTLRSNGVTAPIPQMALDR